jgi:hypothetical protein
MGKYEFGRHLHERGRINSITGALQYYLMEMNLQEVQHQTWLLDKQV